MYAVLAVALLAVVGIAVDLSRTIGQRQAMHNALDSAALLSAKMLEDSTNSDADITTSATAMFKQNLAFAHSDLSCPNPLVAINRNTYRVDLSVQCALPTTFASLLGTDQVDFSAASSALANMTKLDLALMLDVSGSMGGGKIADLKAAAKQAADILITPESGGRVRMAFDTYSTAVNAGPFAAAVKGPTYVAGKNCVSERTGAAAFKGKVPAAGQWLGGLATSCPPSTVLPLTADKNAFKAGIDSLSAGGMTAGHLGIAWAWYLIDPDWSAIWPPESTPMPYDEPQGIKAVILMTDGEFNTQYNIAQGNSVQQAKKMCKQMRDEGIQVYSVAFQAPSAAKDVLKDCAGNDDARFFDATDGEELKRAYEEIASQLTNLRLAQ